MKFAIEKRDGKFIVLREGAEVGNPHDSKGDAIAALAMMVEGTILAPILEEGTDKPGSKWAVVVIQEGRSKNNTFYPADVLRAATKLYEGRPVFWNHDVKGGMRDPRDMAGFIRSPKFVSLESKQGAIAAVLHATTQTARERLMEAHEAGNPEMFGISHTALAEYERVQLPDGPALRVKAIKAVESVDIVSFPSAGGRVMRLVAGSASPVLATEDFVMFEAKLKLLRESYPTLAAKLSATPTEEEVDKLLLEAAAKAMEAPAKPAAAPAMSDADRSLLHEARVERIMKGRTFGDLEDLAREALAESNADEPGLVKLAEVYVAKAAKLAEAKGKPAPTKGRPRELIITEAIQDEADKLVKALDGFFEQKDVDKVPRFTSIREAYIQITGDRNVTGYVSEAEGIGRFARLVEGVASGTWASVLASTLNRQLVREYNAKGGAYSDFGQGWLYDVVPANDFRNRERARFGGYGNFAIVPEGIAYPLVTSPTDEKASYAVAKRGGIETLTWEMIRNDDVGAVRRIPQRLAFAARRTFYEFVHNLYALNPAIYDAVALFHANHGSNLGAAALAAASFTAARLVMLKQAEKDSAKRIGLVASHLMIPPDLWETAYNLFVRNTNLDPAFIQAVAAPTIHIITHLTDTNDWFACAGVDQTPQIEIGFLDGREDPELFVADMPNSGSLFASDKIDYKLRHVYGGAVIDFRGFFGAFGI